MLWGNTAYSVKLSGKELSRYSNKIRVIYIKQVWDSIRKNYFSQHLVRVSSKLAKHELADVSSVNWFNNKLDECWTDMGIRSYVSLRAS